MTSQQQVYDFKKEKRKYDVLRTIDQFANNISHLIKRTPSDGYLSSAFRRYTGPRDEITGQPIHPSWNRAKQQWENNEIPEEHRSGWIYAAKNKKNLLTTASGGGRDYMHAQVYTNAAAGLRGANFLGVTNDAAAASAADTVLASEITTNGLTRIDASSGTTHTLTATTSVLVWTFTCATAPQASQKAGTFTAVSAGVLVHEAVYTAVSLQIADQLQITWTFTLS